MNSIKLNEIALYEDVKPNSYAHDGKIVVCCKCAQRPNRRSLYENIQDVVWMRRMTCYKAPVFLHMALLKIGQTKKLADIKINF